MHLDYICEYLFVSYNTTTNRDNYMYNKKWYFIYLKYKRCFNRPRCDFSSLFLKYMVFFTSFKNLLFERFTRQIKIFNQTILKYYGNLWCHERKSFSWRLQQSECLPIFVMQVSGILATARKQLAMSNTPQKSM